MDSRLGSISTHDLYSQGQKHEEQGDLSQAVILYGRVIDQDPRYWPAYASRGIAHYRMKKYLEAEADLTIIPQEQSVDPRAHEYLAKIYQRSRRHALAVMALTRAIILIKPQVIKRDSQTMSYLESLLLERAISNQRLGQYDRALKDYDLILQINSCNMLALVNRATIPGYFSNVDERIQYYSTLIDVLIDDEYYSLVTPKHPGWLHRLYFTRGELLLDQGRMADARNDFNLTMIESHQNNAYLHYLIGITYLGQFELDKAKASFNRALQLDGAIHPARVMSALIHSSRGQFDEALLWLDGLESDFPDKNIVLITRASIREAQGNAAGAVNDYQSALKCWPENNEFWLFALWRLHLLGGLPPGSDFGLSFARMAERNSRYTGNNCVVMLVQASLGQGEQAMVNCQKFLENHLPDAVPFYLKDAFLGFLAGGFARPPGQFLDLSRFSDKWLEQVKDQLFGLMTNTRDKGLTLNAALQSLSRQSLLGQIFHHRRGFKTPSIRRGRLAIIAAFLEANIQRLASEPLSETTIGLLKEEARLNSSFEKDVRQSCPGLYQLIAPYMPEKTRAFHEDAFFSLWQIPRIQRNDRNHSIQADKSKEEGNRFINNL